VNAATAAVLAVGWILGWALAGRRRTLPAAGPVGARVSVIVPARDEAAKLPCLLDSLAADPQPYEVVVVDDRSTDGTLVGQDLCLLGRCPGGAG
jgi:hypothetical protein